METLGIITGAAGRREDATSNAIALEVASWPAVIQPAQQQAATKQALQSKQHKQHSSHRNTSNSGGAQTVKGDEGEGSSTQTTALLLLYIYIV